jgi:hypothetical protein|tara:strand:- start:297 stop:521 length:225 start_codon:yes stop_codon:yes gene_type:complete
MNTIKFIIEEYVDKNSKNMCEMFSVIINENKVYERDYGSQTERIQEYIEDYESAMGLTSYDVIVDGKKEFNINI